MIFVHRSWLPRIRWGNSWTTLKVVVPPTDEGFIEAFICDKPREVEMMRFRPRKDIYGHIRFWEYEGELEIGEVFINLLRIHGIEDAIYEDTKKQIERGGHKKELLERLRMPLRKHYLVGT